MIYLQLEQNPVPASRPRVTQWGVYYGKNYTKYRKGSRMTVDAAVAQAQAGGFLPLDSTLMMAQLFEVARPKTTKLEYPNPDLDNFIKALWDALQKHGVILEDKKVIASIELKRWTTTQPQTLVLLQTVTSQDMKHALSAPPQTLLQDMMMGMATALAVDTTK
ncbi:MAG: RusA family crossover junction endodeoxyribonuclease [Gammaproteobacteria bacterium]|nr:RusA family crossover junction endodeoxyribonuclease [Gammaproteobacteria bacterium]